MTIQIEKLESLLDKEHVDVLDVVGALDYCLNAKAVEFQILNDSRKAWGKPIRSAPTRIAQKGTLYSKDGEVVQASPSSTKGATQAFKSAREDNAEEYAAILLDSLLPSESAKLSALLAVIDEVDFASILGEEAGEAAEKLAQATLELFLAQVEINDERLPTPVSRKAQSLGDKDAHSEADQSNLTPAQRAANRIAKLKGNPIPYDNKEESDGESGESETGESETGEKTDFNADEIDELTEIKYVGQQTAEKLLANGWTRSQIAVQYKLHNELPEQLRELLSPRAARALMETL
jgi:hypothetical protein